MSDTKPYNEYVFPQPCETAGGITMRDYFAAKAMEGYTASIGIVASTAPTDEDLARYSYEIADAMLAERVK